MCWFDDQIGVQSILALYSKHKNAAASVEFLALYSKQKTWTATVNNFSCQFRQELANSVANASKHHFFLGQSRHHFNVPINQFQFSDRALADCCWPVAAISGALLGSDCASVFERCIETSYLMEPEI